MMFKPKFFRMRNYAIIIFLVLCVPISNGQEEAPQEDLPKSHNITAQLGFPVFTGLNYEYRLPVLGRKLAPEIDLGFFPFSGEGYSTSVTYYALGANYYFLNNFKPLYIGADYGTMPVHTTEIDGEVVDRRIQFTMFNTRLGINTGQTVFFRFELGYSLIFYDIDEANDYLSESYGVRIKPSLDYLQLPNLTLGLGYKF